MTTVNYINLFLELWGCVLSFLVAVCLLLGKYRRELSLRLYFFMLFFNTGALFFDAAALFFRGRTDTLSWWGVRLSNFTAFTCNYLLLAVFAWYMTSYLNKHTRVTFYPLYLVWSLCGISVLLMFATQFFPIFYYIDANNIYHRAPAFWLSQVTGIVGMISCSWLMLRYRHVLEAQEKLAFWIYLVLPVAALICQMFTYGVVLLGLVNTISLTLIFLVLQAKQGRQMAEQENQLIQNRISIMLSQIQPHFLYNSLNSIYHLCGKDSQAAQNAIEKFSQYLRTNLDSLKATAPVPFERELEHVKVYLSLEKMRFAEELNIVYDIKATSFMIPSLTVQPLVENAVKYGVGKKTGGGTVIISTEEKENTYTIIIKDDGVGYNINIKQEDGRSHIGIDNVRARLDAMCGGILSIDSKQGIGTAAVIQIPKENIKNECYCRR